jgi:hypothetical protein
VKVSTIFQVETRSVRSGLAKVVMAIVENQLNLEHVRAVRTDVDCILWEITVHIGEGEHDRLLARLNALCSARILGWSLRVPEQDWGGKSKVH